jgi:hypothetical protein
MTKEELFSDDLYLDELFKKHNDLENYSAAEIGHFRSEISRVEGKYETILDKLGIEQIMDSNSAADFLKFTCEILRRIERKEGK